MPAQGLESNNSEFLVEAHPEMNYYMFWLSLNEPLDQRRPPVEIARSTMCFASEFSRLTPTGAKRAEIQAVRPVPPR